MQIVIDIPDRIFDTIEADEMISREQLAILQIHILRGTMLPKNHGRLIDGDELKEKLKEHHDFYINSYDGREKFCEKAPFDLQARVDEIGSCIAEVVNAPTILESSEEN